MAAFSWRASALHRFSAQEDGSAQSLVLPQDGRSDRKRQPETVDLDKGYHGTRDEAIALFSSTSSSSELQEDSSFIPLRVDFPSPELDHMTTFLATTLSSISIEVKDMCPFTPLGKMSSPPLGIHQAMKSSPPSSFDFKHQLSEIRPFSPLHLDCPSSASEQTSILWNSSSQSPTSMPRLIPSPSSITCHHMKPLPALPRAQVVPPLTRVTGTTSLPLLPLDNDIKSIGDELGDSSSFYDPKEESLTQSTVDTRISLQATIASERPTTPPSPTRKPWVHSPTSAQQSLRRGRKYSEGDIKELYKQRQSYRQCMEDSQIIHQPSNSPTPGGQSATPSVVTHRYSHPTPLPRRQKALYREPATRHTFLLVDDKYPNSKFPLTRYQSQQWLDEVHDLFGPLSAENADQSMWSDSVDRISASTPHSNHNSYPYISRGSMPRPPWSSSGDTIGSSLAKDISPASSLHRFGLAHIPGSEPYTHWLLSPRLTPYLTWAMGFLLVMGLVGIIYGGLCFSWACRYFNICSAGVEFPKSACQSLGIEGSTAILATGVIFILAFIFTIYKRQRVKAKYRNARPSSIYYKAAS
ncbi:hypothetical protein IWQ61_004101 [Dispira simplex]|nr:hypothetical protein IWQ61_004101 [Dispira simplex]